MGLVPPFLIRPPRTEPPKYESYQLRETRRALKAMKEVEAWLEDQERAISDDDPRQYYTLEVEEGMLQVLPRFPQREK